MKLLNADQGFVDIRKLRDYCLNPEHPRGQHKARPFARVLGLTASSAEELQGALLDAARTHDATFIEEDDYGRRYSVEFVMTGPNGSATVRSLWLIRYGEGFPRLVTCYVA